MFVIEQFFMIHLVDVQNKLWAPNKKSFCYGFDGGLPLVAFSYQHMHTALVRLGKPVQTTLNIWCEFWYWWNPPTLVTDKITENMEINGSIETLWI